MWQRGICLAFVEYLIWNQNENTNLVTVYIPAEAHVLFCSMSEVHPSILDSSLLLDISSF
jgi:hypothetical protein